MIILIEYVIIVLALIGFYLGLNLIWTCIIKPKTISHDE